MRGLSPCGDCGVVLNVSTPCPSRSYAMTRWWPVTLVCSNFGEFVRLSTNKCCINLLLSALFCPCCELSALFLTRCHIESIGHCFLQHEFLDRVSPGLELPFFLHIHLLSMDLTIPFPHLQDFGSKHMPTFSLTICHGRPCLLKFNSTHSSRPFPLNFKLIFYLT